MILTSRHTTDGVLVRTGHDGTDSFSTLTVEDASMPFNAQLEAIAAALDAVAGQEGTAVLTRIFLSDPAGQADAVRAHIGQDTPLSVIGQVPLDGTSISAMVWCRRGAVVTRMGDRMYRVDSDGYSEYWFCGGTSACGDSHAQTVALLDELSDNLKSVGLTLEDDCMRTWLFVRDIDFNYKGVVEGRNQVFDRHNLTADTHFIASTGIEGRTENAASMVMLDAVAVTGSGVTAKYIHGTSHLNRTSEYGVRFERGTVVELPAGKRVFISGTASIDNKGNILYEGDAARQTQRMLENVDVLLAEAGSSFADVGVMTVYLRNASDYGVVKNIFDKRFPDTPRVIVLAPVCRPGWLVEMECVGIIENY